MGSGYVGMSLAVLLAQYNDVVVLDVDASRVEKVNNKQSTVADAEIEAFLAQKELCLTATLDKQAAYKGASFVVVATPTNYDPDTNRFDTSSVDSVVGDALEQNSDALVVIKSTIPVGHTKSLQEKHNTHRVIFSPEFLREGQALKDNLCPSRIIVGSQLEAGKAFAKLLVKGAEKSDIETLFIRSTEAEAVKLFANTYLAMRVSFFNELDSYSLAHDLNTESIITGVCLDERIGEGYKNHPLVTVATAFQRIQSSFSQTTIRCCKPYSSDCIVKHNPQRLYCRLIIKLNPKVVGVYRLVMKQALTILGRVLFREL